MEHLGTTMYSVDKLCNIGRVVEYAMAMQLCERYSFAVYPQLQELLLGGLHFYEKEDTYSMIAMSSNKE